MAGRHRRRWTTEHGHTNSSLDFGSGELISCGPHGFKEEDFLSFSHYKSMGANDPQGLMVSGKKIFEGKHMTPWACPV